ncbi:MAG TPA: polyribonucleotide nucleotidyltransferase [Bacteroidota bacterium]
MEFRKELDLAGRTLLLETGTLAKQADGAALVRYGDTIVLATVVGAREAAEDRDYFPLSVDYREKPSAVGRIPGGFIKREGRPTEKEVVSARLIDRPIRPLFPDHYMNETQVMVQVFSSDQENDADVLGAIGSSLALMLSEIPWDGPIAEVRMGRVNGEMIVNPTRSQLEGSDMDIVVAGSDDSIVMVEGEAKEITENDLIKAIEYAHEAIKKINSAIREVARECGKPKREFQPQEMNADLVRDVEEAAARRISELNRSVQAKEERKNSREALEKEVQDLLAEKYPEQQKSISEILHELERSDVRKMILGDGVRMDGRSAVDIRPIQCTVGLLPRTHGSALFTRGETQSVTTVTLGTKLDEQLIEGLVPEYSKRFMLHYNFPPFSVGEIRRIMGPGRREIGHGNLAERALKSLVPGNSDFPYTVRIVSDILESNGSSSMATVCAGSLALMDAGVPIRKAVAGIAMGLVKENENVVILSDILGSEDHLGDMDFKVAGTRDGITGFQMDIKIKGITFAVLEKALEQARLGRMSILDIMDRAIADPRPDLSPYAPRLTTIRIPVDMIGTVIGPGGKNIRRIVQETGAEISIEDDGRVVIASVNKEPSEKAKAMIERMVEMPEVGKTYRGTVKRIMEFGAFVEILPGKEGLVHISQIDTQRVNKVSDVLKVGDEIEVKLVEIDKEGRYNLSRKALLLPPGAENEERHRRFSGQGGGHGGGRGRHREPAREKD